MGKQRLFYVDALRGFAILLVIIGHLSQGIWEDAPCSFLLPVVNIFHMSLFMLISGYVINIETFPIKTHLKILIPFFFWGLLNIYLFKRGTIQTFMCDEWKNGYWFLWAIVIFCLFLYVIRILKINIIIGIIGIEILLLGVFYFTRNTLFCPLSSIRRLLILWPFYSLGIILNRGLFTRLKSKAKMIFISNILIIIFISAISKYLFPQLDLINLKSYPILRMILAFPICIDLLLAFYYAEQFFKGNKSKIKLHIKEIGNVIGKHTLQIYVLHYFILDITLPWRHSLGQYMINNNIVRIELIISPILAILISYICVYISKLIYKLHLGIVFGR